MDFLGVFLFFEYFEISSSEIDELVSDIIFSSIFCDILALIFLAFQQKDLRVKG